MRATWDSFRKKAAGELDTFKQLLFVDSDEESRASAKPQPDVKSQWSEDSQNVAQGQPTSDQHVPISKPISFESPEQRMRMIDSIGEVPTGGSSGSLEDFTSHLISHYTDGPSQMAGSNTKASSIKVNRYNRMVNQASLGEYDSNQPGELLSDPNSGTDTGASIIISSRLYILYSICCALEELWADIESRVSDATGFSMELHPLPRSQLWKECTSVHNDHAEKILTWIERSFHNMGVLAHVVGIGDAKVFSSSSLLADCLNAAMTDSTQITTPGKALTEESAGEYMRLIKFITKLQSDYERRLQKLQITQDHALVQAKKANEIEEEVEKLKEKIKTLEEELDAKNKELGELSESLNSANTVMNQLVQKNEHLIATNQRLLMTKSDFIDKDTVNKMIQQYYEHERTGSHRREDIIQLLERMLGVEPPTQTQEQTVETNVKTLASQFIDFLEEEVED